MTHRLLAALTLAVAVSLAGCAGTPSAEETPRPAIEQFAELPGVIEVTPYDASATVTLGADAPDDEVLAAAASIQSIAEKAEWEGSVTLERETAEPFDAELDQSNRPPWTLEVFPGTERTLDDLTQLLLLEKLDPSANLTVIDGWPYVSVAATDGLTETFRELVANELFAEGGTVSQGDEHLRIVWVPTRTSLHAIDEIIGIAVDYPQAEVLLQATTEGPQWPTLYVARVTADEAAAIEERLLDPSLADADVEGYGLPYIITVIGSDGPTYLDGNLGGVVEG